MPNAPIGCGETSGLVCLPVVLAVLLVAGGGGLISLLLRGQLGHDFLGNLRSFRQRNLRQHGDKGHRIDDLRGDDLVAEGVAIFTEELD
jgi:hypothetical protein